MEATGTVECVAIGAGISFLTSLLKKIPLISSYPKIIAATLSVLVGGIQVGVGNLPPEIVPVLTCVLTQLMAAIGTFEIVTKPLSGEAKANSR